MPKKSSHRPRPLARKTLGEIQEEVSNMIEGSRIQVKDTREHMKQTSRRIKATEAELSLQTAEAKKPEKKRQPREDQNQTAHRVMQEIIRRSES